MTEDQIKEFKETEKEAEEQCRLAVKESIEHNPSKLRHSPYTYKTMEEK